jgi:hypothetical protein
MANCCSNPEDQSAAKYVSEGMGSVGPETGPETRQILILDRVKLGWRAPAKTGEESHPPHDQIYEGAWFPRITAFFWTRDHGT